MSWTTTQTTYARKLVVFTQPTLEIVSSMVALFLILVSLAVSLVGRMCWFSIFSYSTVWNPWLFWGIDLHKHIPTRGIPTRVDWGWNYIADVQRCIIKWCKNGIPLEPTCVHSPEGDIFQKSLRDIGQVTSDHFQFKPVLQQTRFEKILKCVSFVSFSHNLSRCQFPVTKGIKIEQNRKQVGVVSVACLRSL